jgi:hypothetical protein
MATFSTPATGTEKGPLVRRIAAALALFVACSSNEHEQWLGIRWTPPSGVKPEKTATDGPVTVAKFSGGVEVRRVAAEALPTSGDLDALKAALLEASGARADGEVASAKAGTIPLGPVVRWETRSGDDRTLLYYVPAKTRYYVFTLTAAAASFEKRSQKLELSLSSLKLP